MGKLRACVVIALVALVACGSSNNTTPVDAKAIDAPRPIDAKIFMDAPPPMYDLTCFGVTPPTTADATVTVSGTTETFNQSLMLQAVPSVAISTYKSGVVAPLDTVTSSATDGTFTTGMLVTGGMPLDAYAKASKAGYRTTYLYPPSPLTKGLAMVPVPVLTTTSFALAVQLVSNSMDTQDDANNGAMLVTVTDCALTPMTGATLNVKQSNASVGHIYDLGALSAAAAGVYLVTNVPDGPTSISAVYNAMNFPAHTVLAHKQDANMLGSLTVSAVKPGP
ncbi:MAG: hypothetical protein JWO36_2560 [Myxococcales bacterium]|nr:hypothetical protein [Myxococcales bacterium]